MRLIAQNLTAKRGGEILFSGLDICLCEHELLTVTGANGAGKSTLLRIIAGLFEPVCGVFFLEHDGKQLPLSPFTHYLGEENAMKSQLSIRANLGFWKSYYSGEGQSVETALDSVELSSVIDLPFGALSTGQRRRIAIARLLLAHRPLWIVDEPTSGLDQAACMLFAKLMKAHLESGGMIIAATHLPLGVEASQNIAIAPPAVTIADPSAINGTDL